MDASPANRQKKKNIDLLDKDVESMILADLAVINEAKVAAEASKSAEAMREELQEEADKIISKTLISKDTQIS